MNRADSEWSTFGARGEIDKALNTISTEEFRTGAIRQKRRRDVLSAYRKGALRGTDLISGQPFSAPLSSMSPPPDKWSDAAGWFSTKFEMSESLATESHSRIETSGFAGLSLGFCTIGGRSGSTTTTDNKYDKVSKLSYSFELKRISIRRDWLDSTVFFEPRSWTWIKPPVVGDYPRVTVTLNPFNLPQESAKNLYDNKRISFALLPVEAIIARNLSATATMSKTDYEKIHKDGSAGGGVALFGIFGGAGKRNYDITDIREAGESTTFTVEGKGISVIGLISQVLPVTPDPNAADKWPANAWLPK